MGFKEYLERINVFKTFGYDLDKERNFILDKVMPIEGSILEVGTGKGHFTVALAQKGYQFVTVDISGAEQKFAQENIIHLGLEENVVFKVGNAEKLEFEDRSFDAIFAVNLIHHLANAVAVIDEMLRIVSARGRIVLSDFNSEGFELIERIHMAEGKQHYRGDTSLDDIGCYVEQKGFCVKSHETKLHKMIIVTEK